MGDLLSLTLNSEDSGVFSLGPGKGSAKLFVPSEAILQGRELTIKHCTLLDGPFHIPKDCYIVSPVLYIDYNVSLVKNALELHLNHWYAGEDQQKTMTFLKASHVPDEKGFFNFEKCDGGLFNDDVHFGVLKLHNHLCLICVAVKRTQLSSLKCSCRVMLLKKQFEDPRIVSFALYLIFDNVEWIEVSVILHACFCSQSGFLYYNNIMILFIAMFIWHTVLHRLLKHILNWEWDGLREV